MSDKGLVVGAKRRRPDAADKEQARSSHGRTRSPAAAGAGRREHEEPDLGVKPRLDVSKYFRGEANDARRVDDKKLKSKIKRSEHAARSSAKAAAQAELLLTEEAGYLEAEGMERTYKFKQTDIAEAVDLGVARKAIDFKLDTYGPYRAKYSRTGRHMLLGGAKGHIALVDWNKYAVAAEFNVREEVRDVTFLSNHSMFAVAQQRYTYIYDNTGMEIHCLRSHIDPLALDYLPYHFLLASVGNSGYLKYQDVSTGELVAEHRTKMGPCNVMRQNPWNAVMALGHSSGVVSMWTPNMSTPVVKMLTHRGAVTALAVDAGGRYMVTCGMDARMKVWDIRKFGDIPLASYFTPTPGVSVDISARGLTAVAYGGHVAVWGADAITPRNATPITASMGVTYAEGASAASASLASMVSKRNGEEFDRPKGAPKAASPYMRHELPGQRVCTVRFRPWDDVLAVGHSGGLSSLIVPGAGEPNYDTLEADPFQTKKARHEAEVHALLDKLSPAMITLDPTAVGAVDRASADVKAREKAEDEAAARDKKKRGKSKSQRKALKKTANVVTAQRAALREKVEARRAAALEAKAAEEAAAAAGGADAAAGRPASALSRFYNKK